MNPDNPDENHAQAIQEESQDEFDELDFNGFQGAKQQVTSAIKISDLIDFFRCPYRYHLKTNIGLSKLPKSAFAIEVMFFENMRRQLYNLRPRTFHFKEKGKPSPHFEMRAGPDLKTAEEMDRSELEKHLAFAPGAFGNSASSKWKRIIDRGEYAGSHIIPIPESLAWKMSNDLKIACDNYHEFVLEQGVPVSGFFERDEFIEFMGYNFQVTFHEIRPGGMIDHPSIWGYKTGLGFSAKGLPKAEQTLSESVLVTLTILAYTKLANETSTYRRKWELPEDKPVEELVVYRHLNCAKNELNITTRRAQTDYDALEKIIEYFLTETSKGRFPPNNRTKSHCNSCPYNVEHMPGKIACDEANRG